MASHSLIILVVIVHVLNKMSPTFCVANQTVQEAPLKFHVTLYVMATLDQEVIEWIVIQFLISFVHSAKSY